ncbi:MAG: choice-of-anchor L domain-containing protein [bacterium]
MLSKWVHLIWVVLCLPGIAAAAGIAVTPLGGAATGNTLANLLVGSGVTISDVTYVGATGAAGTFTGGAGILDSNSGVVLSTGAAIGIIGPDAEDSSVCWGLPGDSDLQTTFSLAATYDASDLEFDFVPTTNLIGFSYVFGTDEFPDYVGEYDDAFAIYVNGVDQALVLTPHYPNPDPANGDTGVWLPYSLNVPATVTISIYDVFGELVRRLASVFQSAGDHEQKWDIRNDDARLSASGVCLCRIKAVSEAGESASLWEKCAVAR